jgi:N-acetylmuramoyl-L-alanine amidase CwlA
MTMTEMLLTPNKYSRPQRPLSGVKAIVLHWFMSPGQSARSVWAWWDGRRLGDRGYGSAHVIIDDADTILAVPLDEMAYHVGSQTYTDFALQYIGSYPNAHAIGVELAHADMTGRPSSTVWQKAVDVCVDLCRRFDVPVSMIVTHFDVTGMQPHWNGAPCHRWFVERPGELARFQAEVRARVNVT